MLFFLFFFLSLLRGSKWFFSRLILHPLLGVLTLIQQEGNQYSTYGQRSQQTVFLTGILTLFSGTTYAQSHLASFSDSSFSIEQTYHTLQHVALHVHLQWPHLIGSPYLNMELLSTLEGALPPPRVALQSSPQGLWFTVFYDSPAECQAWIQVYRQESPFPLSWRFWQGSSIDDQNPTNTPTIQAVQDWTLCQDPSRFSHSFLYRPAF